MGLDMYLNLKQYKEGKTFEQHKKLLDLFWRYTEVVESKEHFENEVKSSNTFGLDDGKIVLLILEDKEHKEDFNYPLDEFAAYGAVVYKGVKRKYIDLYQEGEITSDKIEEYKETGLITLTDDKEIRELFYNRAQESLDYYNHHLHIINKEISELKGTQDYEILLDLISKWSKDFNLYEDLTESLNEQFIENEYDEFMYWRKANYIHNWMVQNIQDGEDDCTEYHLTWESTMKLMEDIATVLANRHLAEEILPTTSGFFFGSEGYDEHYYQELERTLDGLIATKKYKDNGYELFYNSSW